MKCPLGHTRVQLKVHWTEFWNIERWLNCHQYRFHRIPLLLKEHQNAFQSPINFQTNTFVIMDVRNRARAEYLTYSRGHEFDQRYLYLLLFCWNQITAGVDSSHSWRFILLCIFKMIRVFCRKRIFSSLHNLLNQLIPAHLRSLVEV